MGDVRLSGPDLARGVPLAEIPDNGLLGGHADGKPVLLSRDGANVWAVDGACTHYSGPLAEGLKVGETVRCPWHHACFNLKTGEAVGAPAPRPLATWTVEQKDGRVFVRAQSGTSIPRRTPRSAPKSVVIIGAGAAGDAAADMLRREGYDGSITMIVGSSRVDLQACKLEYSIVSPK